MTGPHWPSTLEFLAISDNPNNEWSLVASLISLSLKITSSAFLSLVGSCEWNTLRSVAAAMILFCLTSVGNYCFERCWWIAVWKGFARMENWGMSLPSASSRVEMK